LRKPLVRRAGELREATWAEAWQAVEDGLAPLLERHGRNAVAVYLGNPSAHNLSTTVYGQAFVRALGSQNVYSASTVDQMPKQVSAGLMFGAMLSVPVPDLDRCRHLLVLGANPLVSNGSLMTSPDARGRIRAIRARGGKVVVVDPRRSRTADEADEHHAIVPGTDAQLLFGIVHTLFDERLVKLGRLADHCAGVEEVERLAADFAPERVEPVCGIAAGEIRRMARELAAAERGACYGRIGTCTQEFGTLASWLVDVVNALTGNLDREGGAMFTRAAAAQRNSSGAPGSGKGVRFGRWRSRVRGLPETYGELPVVCLAEEIETPGDGQVRALITIAGNPVVSTPESERLDRALDELDFMLSLDIYVNETTRHADVILPGPAPLARSHYDLALYQLAVRNVANYSPPAIEPEPDLEPEWRSLLRLMAVVTGQGADADLDALDSFVLETLIQRAVGDEQSPAFGRDPEELRAALAGRSGPDRALDLFLRTGPYGDGFGAKPDGLSLDVLEQRPHGIDLGPLAPRIPELLRTPSGKVELAPAPLVADVDRLRASLERARNGQLVLIGRRQLRSNNSWMHNLRPLVKGKDRCTMHVNPADAERLGLADGALARLTSQAGTIEAPVEVTDAIRAGVVSIPHGWGHDAPGVRLAVAREHAGVNSNVLASSALIDPLSGNAVLNGIPVEVEPAAAASAPPGAEAPGTPA
jgi:anaerobic selenocysteine-containing dehydrogenase